MIQAIRQFTPQNKVKVQKQNFGHVPTWVTESCPKAHKYLIQVQGRPEIFEKGDKVILQQKIVEARAKKQFGAALHLEQLEKFVEKLQLG